MRRPRMTRFERRLQSRDDLKKAEASGEVADSMDVRIKLVERMHAGELTLEQVQAELKRIKREAKKNGLVTRAQAYRGHRP